MANTRRLETVCATLAARGYATERRDGHAVARPSEDTDRVGIPGVLHVVPARTQPAAVLGAVGAAAGADRTALFAAHPAEAEAIRSILTDPPGLLEAGEAGRTFYSGPDRLRAGDAGLACCRGAEPPVWREKSADGVTGEGTRYVLDSAGEATTAFRDFAALACPGRAAFDYAYRRDEDGRFVVQNLETGRTAGRFASITAMKAQTYRPVPVPLVPERLVEGHLPASWAVATVENGRVVGVEGA
jgi:hypothetical protein